MENIEKNAKKEEPNTNDGKTLGVENDLRVVISSKEDGVVFDQICCTCINIILNDDGEIATSFMGVHNENIIKQLEKAMKAYYKAIKKTLRDERRKAKSSLDEEAEDSKKDDNKSDPNTKESSLQSDKDSESNKNANSTEESKVVDTNSPKYSHECDESGKCNCKKKIDKPTTKSKSSRKTKTSGK